MVDREKVIKGLECIRDYDPMFRVAHDDEFSQYAVDALALLKAQEPRVMTLDELSEKTDVWFESLVYDTIDPALSSGSYDDGTVGLMTLGEELFYLDEADYGKTWRCWTSRPTDEQREEAKWE